MKKTAFITLTLFIIIVLSITQVVVANSISTTGITLSKLQSELSEYKKQNAVLKEQVLAQSSFEEIMKKAEKLGFTQTHSSIFIADTIPLALR